MTANNTIPLDRIANACDAAGLDFDEVVYQGYSGRAMYGATCFGVTHNGVSELLQFVLACDREGLELDFLESARQDDLGLSTITYFPGFELS
jgi:hypothetical protein